MKFFIRALCLVACVYGVYLMVFDNIGQGLAFLFFAAFFGVRSFIGVPKQNTVDSKEFRPRDEWYGGGD